MCEEKSYVSLERRICVVCTAEYDTNSLLLDKRLRPSMLRYTTTGWGLCPPHEEMFNGGMIALVECHADTPRSPSNIVKPGDARRTGNIAHIKREIFSQLCDVEIDPKQPCVFVEPGTIEKVVSILKPDSHATEH